MRPSNTEPVICFRCGRIGHLTQNCTQEMPTIEQMKVQFDSRTRNEATSCPNNWVSDEYGLYIKSPRSIETDKSFADGPFCLNCGSFSHSTDDCDEPSFDTLYKMFMPYLNDHSSNSTQKKKEIIKSINKFCKLKSSRKSYISQPLTQQKTSKEEVG